MYFIAYTVTYGVNENTVFLYIGTEVISCNLSGPIKIDIFDDLFLIMLTHIIYEKLFCGYLSFFLYFRLYSNIRMELLSVCVILLHLLLRFTHVNKDCNRELLEVKTTFDYFITREVFPFSVLPAKY